MDYQLIVVIIIGIVVAGKILLGVYRFFFTKKETGFCGSCDACKFNPNRQTTINSQ